MQMTTSEDVSLFKEHPTEFMKDFITLTTRGCEIESPWKHVVICAMHRSASAFFANTLFHVLNYRSAGYAEAYKIEELAEKLNFRDIDCKGRIIPTHQVYFPRLFYWTCSGSNTIASHHIIANAQTLWNFTSIKGIIPIITTRNILDALVSVRDRIVKNFQGRTDFEVGYAFGDHMLRFRTKKALDKFISGSPAYQADFLIDVCSPWYFEFLSSWLEVKRQNILDVLFVSYEELVADELGTIARMIKFIGDDVDEDKIRSVIYKTKNEQREQINLNVAKTGRGREFFTTSQKERLRKIGEYYADDEIIKKYT